LLFFMREMPVLWRQGNQPFSLFASAQRRKSCSSSQRATASIEDDNRLRLSGCHQTRSR